MLLCCLALLPQEVLDIQNNLYQVGGRRGWGTSRYPHLPWQPFPAATRAHLGCVPGKPYPRPWDRSRCYCTQVRHTSAHKVLAPGLGDSCQRPTSEQGDQSCDPSCCGIRCLWGPLIQEGASAWSLKRGVVRVETACLVPLPFLPPALPCHVAPMDNRGLPCPQMSFFQGPRGPTRRLGPLSPTPPPEMGWWAVPEGGVWKVFLGRWGRRLYELPSIK